MAEKKQHTIVSADSGAEVKPAKKTAAKAAPKADSAAKATKAAPKTDSTAKAAKAAPKAAAPASAADKNQAKTKRILAIVFWALAFVFEILAILVIFKKIEINSIPYDVQWIGFLVIDLILVIVGAQFWKQANHMDPVSEAKPLKFWLWNNMGVIVCCFAFIPFIILTLTNKDADPKTKKLASIVAAVALLIGVGCSIDYNPVSQEGVAQAAQTLSGTDVYWTKGGGVYHLSEDCQHLNNSDTLILGTVEEAVAAGKARLCKTCAKNNNLEISDNGAVLSLVEDVVEDIVEEAAVSEEPAA